MLTVFSRTPPGRWFPLEGLPYWIGVSPGLPFSRNITNEIGKVLAASKRAPSMVWWDDLVLGVNKNGKPGLLRLRWPGPDAMLYPQMNLLGRLAVHRAVLERLGPPPDGESFGDWFRESLGMAGTAGKYLTRVFRLVGRQESSVYRTRWPSRPPRRAQSLSVIVNYRDRVDLTQRALSSLAGQHVEGLAEVLLVNNRSSASSVEAVRRYARDHLTGRYRVIHLDYDAHYNHSAQCNLAAARSTGEVLIMLNNDAELGTSQVLWEMASWAASPGVATCGPRVVGWKNRLVSSGMGVVAKKTGRPEAGYCIQELAVRPLSRVVRHTVGNSFACAAVSRRVWEELGGLDAARFPDQLNDADFCLRALRAGYQHVYLGNQWTFHQPGGSGARSKAIIQNARSVLIQCHPCLRDYEGLSPIVEEPGFRYAFSGCLTETAVAAFRVCSRLSISFPLVAPVATRLSEAVLVARAIGMGARRGFVAR